MFENYDEGIKMFQLEVTMKSNSTFLHLTGFKNKKKYLNGNFNQLYLPLGLSKKDSPTLVMHKARGSQPCVTPNQNSTPLHNQIKSKFLPI